MSKSLRADFFLLVIALIWGVTFPLVTAAIKDISPFLFVTLRFSCAALFLLFWVFKKLNKTTSYILMAGIVLGVLNSAVYLFQTFGMQSVDADTSAFLAAAGVIFVPFISQLLKLAKVRRIEYIGTFICLIGLYVLTGANLHQLSPGEFWVLGAAFFWAVSVCFLQKVSPKIGEFSLLAFYQIVFTLPLGVAMAAMNSSVLAWSLTVIIGIIYTGILATAIVFLLQVRYQKDTTATHAAIIYSLEPVLASFFAIYINHENLTWRITAGGGIVLMSILLIECSHLKLKRVKREKTC